MVPLNIFISNRARRNQSIVMPRKGMKLPANIIIARRIPNAALAFHVVPGVVRGSTAINKARKNKVGL
jgi:hypothetical protein